MRCTVESLSVFVSYGGLYIGLQMYTDSTKNDESTKLAVIAVSAEMSSFIFINYLGISGVLGFWG